MALAIRSGIPFEVWLSGDPRALTTALDLLADQGGQARHDDEDPLANGGSWHSG